MSDVIQSLRELRQSSESSVLTGTEPAGSSLRPTIPHPIQEWLVDLILDLLTLPEDRQDLSLIVLAGNSGDGKSHLLREIRQRLKDKEGVNESMVEWVLDATHAKERTQSSSDRLNVFFRPFNDLGSWHPSKLHVIAINTGAAVKFLAEDSRKGEQRSFSELERVLSHQLGISGTPSETWSDSFRERFDRILVVDLDRRMLVGPNENASDFLNQMFDLVSPERKQGVLGGTSSTCTSCAQRLKCPVYANLSAMQLPGVRKRLLGILLDIVLEDRIHVGPRSIWHLCYQLTVGGLDASRIRAGKELATCSDISSVNDDERVATLFYNALFEGTGDVQAGGGAALLAEFRRLDPQYQFSLHSFEASLLAGLSKAEELEMVAPIASRIGSSPTILTSAGNTVERARTALRRAFFFDETEPDSTRHTWLRTWGDQLDRYRHSILDGHHFDVGNLLDVLKRVLDDMYRPGRDRGNNLWALKLPWKGLTDLYAKLQPLRADRRIKQDSRVLGPDAFRASVRPRSRDLADKLQSFPLMINVPVRGGLDIPVTWPLFRLLKRVQEAGYVSGSLDPERLQQLERTGASLGAQAANDEGVAVFSGDKVLLCELVPDGEIDVINL